MGNSGEPELIEVCLFFNARKTCSSLFKMKSGLEPQTLQSKLEAKKHNTLKHPTDQIYNNT